MKVLAHEITLLLAAVAQEKAHRTRAESNVRVSIRLATLGNVTYLLVLALGHIS